MMSFFVGLFVVLFLYLLYSSAVIKFRHRKFDGVLVWQYFIDGIVIGIGMLFGLAIWFLALVGYLLVKGCTTIGIVVVRWAIEIKKFLLGF